jgi:excinuclease ABC subunit C
LDEKQRLPNLVIVDGGKGQLSAAINALEKLELRGKLPVIGIAKRLEEIYYPGDSIPLYIDKTSETLKLIQQMRDEAHRFGITHHRDKRSKAMLISELDSIKGIGEKTKEILLKEFKSFEGLKNANSKEIEKIIGKHKSKVLKEYLEQVTF